ncbi:Lipoma-preferred partner like, partial [Dissostichus eleginoides]
PSLPRNTSATNLSDLTSFPSKQLESAQNSVPSAPSTPNAPVTGYKRMVIPTQPPLTATKKSTPKPQAPGGGSSTLPSSASPVTKPQIQTAPQPVPASYATASTPSQPTFNVQVRSAQPGPHQAPIGQLFGQQPIRSPAQVQYMPAQPKGPDFAYGPPQPGFSQMAQGAYQDQHHPGVHQVGGLSSRRAEPAPAQAYQPPDPRKTYITDVPPSLAPYTAGPAVPPKVTEPSCPALKSYEQLFKSLRRDAGLPALLQRTRGCARCRVTSSAPENQRVCSVQGYQLCSREPEGVLGAGLPALLQKTRGCARCRVTSSAPENQRVCSVQGYQLCSREPEGVLGAGLPALLQRTRGCARCRVTSSAPENQRVCSVQGYHVELQSESPGL